MVLTTARLPREASIVELEYQVKDFFDEVVVELLTSVGVRCPFIFMVHGYTIVYVIQIPLLE